MEYICILLLAKREGNGSCGNQAYVQTLETINLDRWICIDGFR
jgi:hypothetical protein